MQLDVTYPRAGLAAVRIRGDVDSATAEELQEALLAEHGKGCRFFLLDLGATRYLSSSGLRVIHLLVAMLRQDAQAAGDGAASGSFKSPYVKLLKPTPAVRRVLVLTGVEHSLDIFDDEAAALASFVAPAGAPHPAPDAGCERAGGLDGARILFVMGSYRGKRPMYEHAASLGVKACVLDGPGHWTQEATREGLFEHFLEVDLYPSTTLAERAYEAIRESGLCFDAIATFEEFATPLTALLAEKLGLPGHPILAVAYARNKTYTREVCAAAGIPTPRFSRIHSEADLAAATATVGFPAVLKPVSGAASMSTYRVDDAGELQARYRQTIAAAAGRLKSSGVHSDDDNELLWANGFDMTLEEYLDGEEFDVDVLLSRGEMVYAGVGRDLPQPYMVETGSQMPPPFPEDKQAEMVEFVGRVLAALGFVDGVFHVEMKYTSNGPRLIEVNARVGGGEKWEVNRRVWGVDLAEQYLTGCLGVPIAPRRAAQPLTCIMARDLAAPFTGTVRRADFFASVADDPRVVWTKTYVRPGDVVTGPEDGVPQWLGQILVQGRTVEEASGTMDELLAQVSLPVDRVAPPMRA